MKKAVLKKISDLEVIESREPELKKGEAVLDVKACGICHSDLISYDGGDLGEMKFPMVLGHEFGGIISSIGENKSGFKVGDKVAVSPQISCEGNCLYCKDGYDQLCEGLKKEPGENLNIGTYANDGAFAEKISVPIKNMVKLPKDFDMDLTGIIEPATVAYNNTRDISDSNVVVVGTGAIGLMAIRLLKMNNNKVAAVDAYEEPLDNAVRSGADYTLNIGAKDREEKIKEIFKGNKIDLVLLYYVSDDTISFAMNIIKKLGEIKFIGLTPDKSIKIDYPGLLMNSIRLSGCWCYSMEDFRDTIDLIIDGRFKVGDLISAKYPLEKIKEAFSFKHSSRVPKVIIKM